MKILIINNGKRTEWIDNAKGIAIICVILGHLGVCNILTNVIYTFHIPLFFIVSGYYLTNRIQEIKFKDFIKKKIKRLIIPYIFFSVILLIFYNITSKYIEITPNCKNIDYINSFLNIFIELKRNTLIRCHLWFLTCLFISNVIVWTIIKYFNKTTQITLITLLISISFFYNYYEKHTTILFIDAAFVSSFYVYIGNKLQIIYNKFCCKTLILIITTITYIFSSILNYFISGYTNVDMYNAKYGNYVLFIVSSLCGIYLILFFCKKIKLDIFHTEMKL